MANSYSEVCETLETQNIFLFSCILSLVTILIWSCFILKRFVLQVKVVVVLFNLESLFCESNKSCYLFLERFAFSCYFFLEIFDFRSCCI